MALDISTPFLKEGLLGAVIVGEALVILYMEKLRLGLCKEVRELNAALLNEASKRADSGELAVKVLESADETMREMLAKRARRR